MNSAVALSVVWSAQARNQFIATLNYIAAEDPLSAQLVQQRVEKSLSLLCASPDIYEIWEVLDPSPLSEIEASAPF